LAEQGQLVIAAAGEMFTYLFLKYNAENPLRFLILFPRPPVDERYGERPCLQQAQAEMLNPAGADTPGCTCGRPEFFGNDQNRCAFSLLHHLPTVAGGWVGWEGDNYLFLRLEAHGLAVIRLRQDILGKGSNRFLSALKTVFCRRFFYRGVESGRPPSTGMVAPVVGVW
jgi:hypothetical protein